MSYTLVFLFTYLPSIFLSPYTGALVDKINVKTANLLSIIGLLINTIILFMVFILKNESLLIIYMFVAFNSAFNTLQWSAFQKIVYLLFNDKTTNEITKANGFVQAAQSISYLLSPIFSTLVLGLVSINLIISITVILYIVSLILLKNVVLHSKPIISEGKNTWSEIKEGFLFIKNNRPISLLVMYFTFNFFLLGMVNALITPLVLSFANKNSLTVVLTSSGIGMVFGSIAISKWGGPKKRIRGVLIPTILLGVSIIMGGLRESIWLISVSGFIAFFLIPIIRGCGTSIIQSLTPYEIFGRIISIARMLSISSLPLAYLIAGTTIDHMLVPLFKENSQLVEIVYLIIGRGEMREIGLLFVILGIFTVMLGIIGMFSSNLKTLK
ncbi:MFS transporter [Thermolongibacillus altinsuensis]|uniref:MFS transporter n=2 Tax=Thermolongibacillus altinsuensis TaxID=575256 RepID=A0A4R1QEH2_9BACL|nr:MFS transporter [Thermolongibacillus altinsuensis]